MMGVRSDVEELLPGFDAFALTSRTEGLPLVLLEAMATKLPVVSTAVGGIPDLVEHYVTGFLSRADDRAQFTRQLARLSVDRTLSRQVGEAGRDHVLECHSVERMAKQYDALYTWALQSRGSRGRQSSRPSFPPE
ncbi:MAG TPA: glycosyltransferase family 4 protein, partial [Polyangiaceae bacterium]